MNKPENSLPYHLPSENEPDKNKKILTPFDALKERAQKISSATSDAPPTLRDADSNDKEKGYIAPSGKWYPSRKAFVDYCYSDESIWDDYD